MKKYLLSFPPLKPFIKNEGSRYATLIWCALILILIVGAGLRLNKLDWDEGQGLHPDERAIIWQPNGAGVMNLMTAPTSGACPGVDTPRQNIDFPPGGLSFFVPNKYSSLASVPCGQPVPGEAINFWNAAFSPLNPHFFAYGSLPMYLIKLTAHIASAVSSQDFTTYMKLFLVGRFLSVLFSLGTILLVFGIGRRAFGPGLGKREGDAIGLLAAAFLSVSTLDIQLAHFLAFDEPLTFFVTLTVFVAIGQMRNGSRWGAMRLGIALGLALATKFSSAPVAIPAGLSILFYGLYGNAKFSGERATKPVFNPWPGEERYGFVALGPRLIFRTLGNLGILVISTLAAWFIGMPYAFLDFKNYSDRLIEEGGMARGIDSIPYTRQFVGSTPVLYQFENIILWGVGLPLGILIVCALFYSVWRSVSMRLKSEIILWAWMLPYAVSIFSFEAKFIRYNLPLIPFLIIMAAKMLVEVHSRLSRRQRVFSWNDLAKENLEPNLLAATAGPSDLLETTIETAPIEKTGNEYQTTAVNIKNDNDLVAGKNLAQHLIVVQKTFNFDSNGEVVEGEETTLIEKIGPKEKHKTFPENAPTYTRFGKLLNGLQTNNKGAFTWAARGVAALTIFTFAWSCIWAISFEHIYTQTHTRVQASQWIYNNVPAKASVSNEQWDESLPVPLDGQQPSNYKQVSFDIYGDRPPQDVADYLISQIQQTDYIVEASNRLYATIPKLPWRYPVQNRYYQLLFSGNLGYSLVATFSEYPTVPLINWQVNDDHADESFTVYDHPKVYIFKKTQNLTDAELRGLFEASIQAPWVVMRHPKPSDLPQQHVGEGDGALTSSTAGQVTYDGKSLLLDKPVDELPVINDIGWNKPANDQQWFGVILWFVLAQILGLVGLPIAMRVASRLPDKGYILAKPIGAAVMGLVIWLIVSSRVFMNTVGTNYMGLGLCVVLSACLWWRYRDEMTLFFKQRRKIILIEEALFLFAFVLFTILRIGNPDLWHPTMGGEKPMELTHINALLKSAYFPPYDPWFSDGYVNYYYYGQYLFSTWMKLTGIRPGIAFNLAVPIVGTFTITAAFSLIFNLVNLHEQRKARLAKENYTRLSTRGPIVAALLGCGMLSLTGNLDSIVQVFQGNPQIVKFFSQFNLYPGQSIEQVKTFDYWRSSRVVPFTINEFPYFNSLYADFHANVIALPYTLVILGIALNLIATNWLGYNESGQPFWKRAGRRVWKIFDNTLLIPLTLAILVGLLGATNTWDVPTYLVITGVAFFLALFRRPKQIRKRDWQELERSPRLNIAGFITDAGMSVIFMVVTLVIGVALYWNFYAHFQAFYSSISFTASPDSAHIEGYPDFSPHTQLQYFIVLFGIFLFFIISYLAWTLWDWSRLTPKTEQVISRERFNYESFNDTEFETEDEVGNSEEVEPVTSSQRLHASKLPIKRGVSFLKRPQVAFAMASADGGYGMNGGDGGSNWITNSAWNGLPPSGFEPQTIRNRFALPWLVGLGVAETIAAAFTYFNYNWGLLALMLPVIAGLMILLIVRPFDPDPEQAAKARSAPDMLVKLLLLAACFIVAMCEVLYLADDLHNWIYERMNMIFKFYYQVWTLFAIAAAFGGYIFWTQVISPRFSKREVKQIKPNYGDPYRSVGRFSWIGCGVVLLLIGLLYPLLATPVKWGERDQQINDKYCYPTPATAPMPFGLDGQVYLSELHCVVGMTNMSPDLHFDFKYDAQAIKDFYNKVPGTPVVLEASIEPYRGGGSMVTINTGLPTVLGWDHHETQQRYIDQVYARSYLNASQNLGDVREIYNTDDISKALQLLNHYHVTYVHVGVVEREAQVEAPHSDNGQRNFDPYMSDAGYAKFDTMVKLGLLQVAYQNSGVTVYKLTIKGQSGVIPDQISADSNGGVSSNINVRLQRLLDDVKREPDNVNAHLALGQYYVGVKDYSKAAEQYEEIVKLTPKQVNAYQVLGDIYEQMNKMDLALDTYKKAEQQVPDEPSAWNKVGLALVKRNQLDAALSQFQQAVKVSPSFVESYFQQGQVYEKQNKKDLAIQAYKQVVAKADSATNFWVGMAQQRLTALGAK